MNKLDIAFIHLHLWVLSPFSSRVWFFFVCEMVKEKVVIEFQLSISVLVSLEMYR
jgi:hypothetical protein